MRLYSCLGKLILSGLGASVLLTAPAAASVFTVTVDGSDAIFLAGRTDLVIPPASSPWPGGLIRHGFPTPEEIQETLPPFIRVSGGDIIRAADLAVGGVSFFLGFGGVVFGPSGSGLSGSNLSSFGGISGYIGPQGPLTGVFLNDSSPVADPPPTLDFSPPGLGIDFLKLSPALGQVFYIGDGLTSGGDFQEFIAPAGATRLFLGIPDGFGFVGAPGAYDDNDGSYRISIGALSLYFGADTSVHPKLNEFPQGTREPGRYDFYAGRVGFGVYPCYIHENGKDVLDVAIDDVLGLGKGCYNRSTDDIHLNCQCSAFELPAARKSAATYAYWYLNGPDAKGNKKKKSAYDFGVEQANQFLEAWNVYSTPNPAYEGGKAVLTGQTLFGDIEGSFTGDRVGWLQCPLGNEDCLRGSKACEGSKGKNEEREELCIQPNRDLLDGFLDTIATAGLTPGVYTRQNIWERWLGKDFRPSQDFALWLAGCGALCQDRSSTEVISAFHDRVGTRAMGGMLPVVWQYRVEQRGVCKAPGYDVARQDPSVGFTPLEAPPPILYCPCGETTCE